MLRKPKLVVTSSRRLFARWQTSAASTSIAAKVTSLLNKPDDLSYELFCQDALEYLQKYHNKDNANVFVERTWSALPWSTKFRYKHLKDWQTFLIMTYHFKALEKLKRFDGALILPRQQFAKAKQAASTHNVLPQQTRAAKRQSLTVSNSWLTLDSTQRLKYSWNAYREVIALKGNMGGFSREAQIWYRLIRATVRDEVKMANEFQRPIGNYRGDKKPSEKRDRDLRQFELDLAAWEAKMAAMDSSGVARRLQGIEQHQLLLRLTRNARWSTIAVTFAVIVTVTLVTVAQILDALIKPLKEELSARTKKK